VSTFAVAFKIALQHGLVVGVNLPGTGGAVDEEFFELLHPEEAAHARTLRGFRQEQFVGGRLALRSACAGLGRTAGPILVGPRGEPLLSAGLCGSISHKRHLAVALAARDTCGSIGIDFEELDQPRKGVAGKVLRPAELSAVLALPEERQWTATVTRFSLKEAVYKALAPRLQRYIDFSEAEVEPDTDGQALIHLHLSSGPVPVDVEARYVWAARGILATVRARWA